MSNRIVAAIMACVLTFSVCTGAQASSALADAFNGLSTTTSDSGYFKSQVRSSVMLGSGRLRFNMGTTSQPLGINIVPPSLDIGCNGIDWHFGGLSWVNGENIEKMLQAAGPAALMYIINLAINALCEDCQDVLQKVVDALQRAANSSMNSCQLGQNLAQMGTNFASQQFCKNGSAQLGASDNFSAARDMCQGESLFKLHDLGFVKTVNDMADSISNITGDLFNGLFNGSVNPLDMGVGQDKLENNKRMGIGNRAWDALQRAGIVLDPVDIATLSSAMSEAKVRAMFEESVAFGELFMSMMDFGVQTQAEASGASGGSKKTPPQLMPGATIKDPRIFLGILECGTNYFNDIYVDANDSPLPDKAKPIVDEVCGELFDSDNSSPGSIDLATVAVRTCLNNASSTIDIFADNEATLKAFKCYSTEAPQVPKVNLGVWAKRGYVQHTFANGTIGIAVARLYSISEKIRTGTSSSGSCNVNVSEDTGASDSILCPEEIALLQNAPFPLYKVVNLAALFPGLEQELYTTYGRILGLMMAQQYIQNYVAGARQFADEQTADNPQQLKISRMLDKQITMLQEGVNDSLDEVAKQLERATILTQQINSLEQRLRDDIFDRQILGNQAFAQSVSTGSY